MNEKLFGVRSGYDERYYTTELDRNAPEVQKRLAEADKIAREIEGVRFLVDSHFSYLEDLQLLNLRTCRPCHRTSIFKKSAASA